MGRHERKIVIDTPGVTVVANAEVLAQTVASRLISRLEKIQARHYDASLVLTGGRIGNALLGAVRDSPQMPHVDWSHVDIWWGDERFLPPDHPDRNETQARKALLNHIPVDAHRVHAMPALQPGLNVDAAAQEYSDVLASNTSLIDSIRSHEDDQSTDGTLPLPRFDIVLLSIGPDGHIASLFPNSPVLDARQAVAAVHNAPKPPPTRLTLTTRTINSADEVWIMASGTEKAEAFRRALDETDRHDMPASCVRGTHKTRWFADADAAALHIP